MDSSSSTQTCGPTDHKTPSHTSKFNADIFRQKAEKAYDPGSDEYQVYEKMIPGLLHRPEQDKPRVLVITDIEQDYDDLFAIIFLSEMHRLGVVEIAGCIANHKPANKRAFFLRATLSLLNLANVPVAVGTAGCVDPEKAKCYELKNTTFLQKGEEWGVEEDGQALIDRLANETGDGKPPLTVLLLSTLQDISEYFGKYEGNEDFLKTHFKKFVSQGGYSRTTSGGVKRSGNQNMNFNKPAADHYTSCLTKHKLPSDSWAKPIAVKTGQSHDFIEDVTRYGAIGSHIEWIWERQEFTFFWNAQNDPINETLDWPWYLTTRLNLRKGSDEYTKHSTTPPDFYKIKSLLNVVLYDACAAMGTIGDDLLRKLGVFGTPSDSSNSSLTHHRLFGSETQGPPLDGINAEEMRKVLRCFIVGALRATKTHSETLIKREDVKHSHETYSEIDKNLLEKMIQLRKEAEIKNEEAKLTREEAKKEKDGLDPNSQDWQKIQIKIDNQTATIEAQDAQIKQQKLDEKMMEVPMEMRYQIQKQKDNRAVEPGL